MDFSLDITKENTFWASLIGGSVMWIRYFCFDQSQVQRVLTSKSLKSAKNSFVVSVFVMNIVYYVMLLLGAILFVFYGGKEFATSNEIMITFIIEQMPIGIIGIIIAIKFQVNWLWNLMIGAIITFTFGYILSLLWKQDSNEEQAEKYTALGIRQQVLADESDKGDVPFSFGCRELIVLVFFIMQYVFLYCVQH